LRTSAAEAVDVTEATVSLQAPPDGGSTAPRIEVTTPLDGPRRRRTRQAWQLAGPGVDVEVDGATGTASYRPTGSDRPFAVELWPDVGPPYPGGYKMPVGRPVTAEHAGDDRLVLRSRGNPWLGYGPAWAPAPSDGGYETVRELRVESDGVVCIDTTVRRLGPTPSPRGLRLRTFGRAAIAEPVLSVAMVQRRLTRPVEEGGFPFTLGDAEHVPLSGLPTHPAGYAEPWSAFTNGLGAVGLLWEGADEVRFGGVWLPSALYDIPPLAPGEEYAFPPYRVVVIAGDADGDDVAASWRATRATEAASSPKPTATTAVAARNPAGTSSGPATAMPTAPAVIARLA
jgi:hypothetical protein